MGEFGLDGQKENYGDRMAVIAELHLEYEDGTTECICTDQNWKYCGSDIEDSGIYFGEDLNRLLWEEKENPWKPVEVIADPEAEEGTKKSCKSTFDGSLKSSGCSKRTNFSKRDPSHSGRRNRFGYGTEFCRICGI